MTLQIHNEDYMIDYEIQEQVLVNNDLNKLSPKQRLKYYHWRCKSLGLNPATQPFEYLELPVPGKRGEKKLTLYVKKAATEQLRKLHGVSIVKLEKETMPNGIYVVTAHATAKDGRVDVSTGAISLNRSDYESGKLIPLQAEQLSNAYKKCETQAKHRVTLSICGLGMLDESEIEDIKDARPYIETEVVSHVHEEIKKIPELVEIELDDMINSIRASRDINEVKEAWALFNRSVLKKEPDAISHMLQEKENWMINNGHGDGA